MLGCAVAIRTWVSLTFKGQKHFSASVKIAEGSFFFNNHWDTAKKVYSIENYISMVAEENGQTLR